MEISLENLYVDIRAQRVNFYIIAPANKGMDFRNR